MAGMGRPPKPPALRARTNKTSTAATLTRVRPAKKCALPVRRVKDGKRTKVVPWHPLTRAWWDDVWKSEMASELVHSDVHQLFIMAALVDAFWNGAVYLAGEIRLQAQRFGLSPLDRRRLQWEIDGDGPDGEPPAKDAKRRQRSPRSPGSVEQVLSVLKGDFGTRA